MPGRQPKVTHVRDAFLAEIATARSLVAGVRSLPQKVHSNAPPGIHPKHARQITGLAFIDKQVRPHARRCCSMKTLAASLFLTISASTATAVTPTVVDRSTLLGWGPFRFGQTIAQAAKAAGPASRSFGQAVELDIELEGQSYLVGALALGPSGRVVTVISLSPTSAARVTSREACEAEFFPMIAIVAKRYGRDSREEDFRLPSSRANADHNGKQRLFAFRDGSTVTVINGFSESPGVGAPPCLASIEMKPGRNPDIPPKVRF